MRLAGEARDEPVDGLGARRVSAARFDAEERFQVRDLSEIVASSLDGARAEAAVEPSAAEDGTKESEPPSR